MKNKEYFEQFLTYDPDTGVFASTGSYLKSHKGRPVGYVNPKSGYVYWGHRGKFYLLHRLAWVFMTGEWPAHEVDHIDRDRANQRWGNLRAATRQDNSCNRAGLKPGRLKGAYLRKGKYVAQITRDRKVIYLGTFDTEAEAHAEYAGAAILLHEDFACVA